MDRWLWASILLLLALPPALPAEQPPLLKSYEEGSVPPRNTKPRPPAPTGPMRIYVCGNAYRLSWMLEAPEDHFTTTKKCLPPFALVLVPDGERTHHWQVVAGVPLRYLKLVQGRVFRKSQDENDQIDLEWKQFVDEQRRARALRRDAH